MNVIQIKIIIIPGVIIKIQVLEVRQIINKWMNTAISLSIVKEDWIDIGRTSQ